MGDWGISVGVFIMQNTVKACYYVAIWIRGNYQYILHIYSVMGPQ